MSVLWLEWMNEVEKDVTDAKYQLIYRFLKKVSEASPIEKKKKKKKGRKKCDR
jgi:hypothetical protein